MQDIGDAAVSVRENYASIRTMFFKGEFLKFLVACSHVALYGVAVRRRFVLRIRGAVIM